MDLLLSRKSLCHGSWLCERHTDSRCQIAQSPPLLPPGDAATQVIAPMNSIYVPGAFESTEFTLPPPGVLAPVKRPANFKLLVLNYTQPADGCALVNLSADGQLRMEPAAGYVGRCTFTYAVLDTDGAPLTAVVAVQIGE